MSMKKNKKLYLEDDEIVAGELLGRLKRLSEDSSMEQVLIDADKTCSYGDVMEILDIVKEAELKSIGLAVNKRDANDQ